MHMFIQNVRVPLDFSLDDANLLVACLRSYAIIKNERGELDGGRDAHTLAERVVNQIDERIVEIERKLQAFHDAGMPDRDRDWLPGALNRMEERFRAVEDECSRLDDARSPQGWDTVEGGATFTRGGE